MTPPILSKGVAVPLGASVATLTPTTADELVAYVPANANPRYIALGTVVAINDSEHVCRGNAHVIRVGADVIEAPGQVRGFFRLPVHGTPVYIDIPSGCELGVGQLVSVEFNRNGL